MKKRFWLICFVVFVCILSSTVVWVQEKKEDYSKEIDFLIQVISYGETKKDPLIMISAVRMFDALPFDKITVEGSDVSYERNTLLNKAKEFASDDKEVLAMVVRVQDEKTTVRAPHHHRRHHHHHRPHHRPPPPSYGYGGPGCSHQRIPINR